MFPAGKTATLPALQTATKPSKIKNFMMISVKKKSSKLISNFFKLFKFLVEKKYIIFSTYCYLCVCYTSGNNFCNFIFSLLCNFDCYLADHRITCDLFSDRKPLLYDLYLHLPNTKNSRIDMGITDILFLNVFNAFLCLKTKTSRFMK